MPFGAMRHGFTFQGADEELGIVADYTSLNKTLLQSNYTDLAYAGIDSNDRPVFITAWEDNTASINNGWVQMFAVNGDATVSSGTAVQLDSGNQVFVPSINSERDGAGFENEGSATNYAYVGWAAGGTMKALALSYNVETLTPTLGSILNTGETNTGPPSLAYIGFNQCVYGQRGGNNGSYFVTSILTRSGTTVSKSSNTDLFFYGGTYAYLTMGHPSGNGRWVQASGGNNADGLPFRAYSYDGFNIYEGPKTWWLDNNESKNSWIASMAYLDNGGRMVGSYATNSTAPGDIAIGTYMQIADVNWTLPNVAPTVSFNNRISIDTTAMNSVVWREPGVDDSGIVIVKDPSQVIKYKKFSASGTTLNVDPNWTDAPDSIQTANNWVINSPKRAVDVYGDKYYVMGVRDQSSSPTRDYKIVVIKNP